MKPPGTLRTLKVEEPEPGLWIVTFNRPEVRNAINTATCEDLRDLFGPLAFTPLPNIERLHSEAIASGE